MSGSIFHQGGTFVPDDRTLEDLIEATVCFREACSDGDKNNSMYTSNAEVMLKLAQFRSDNNVEFRFNDVLSSQFLPGSWVIIHGLTSATGVLLNHKLGLVDGQDKTTGRLIVQIDKNEVPKKLLLPRNL